jgi:hypothetical protein
MVNIIKPEFLKWNSNNSKEHFDMNFDMNSWETGGETFFNVFKSETFNLCTYSRVQKEYVLETEGVNIISQEQKSQEMPFFDDSEDEIIAEQHEIEIEWLITDPKGHVFITVDDKRVGIEWADRRIKDLQGNEAKLIPSEPYRVEEILTSDEHDTLIEIKRLARLRDMSTGKTREMLNFKMIGLSVK